MQFLISFMNTILPLLYFATTFFYARYFWREDSSAKRYVTPMLQITVLIHFIDVVTRGIYYKHFPLATIFEASTVLALSVASIYMYIESRIKEKSTGYFILVFVFFMQVISSAFIDFVHVIPEILHDSLFIFHTSAAILGYSALAISAIYGLMYLLLTHDIKSSRFGVIYSRLPSLEILNEMNLKAATIGFFFLTIAIVLGEIWTKKLYGTLLHFDYKILIAIITWFIYGLEIFGKKFFGWSGKRLAILSLSGFAIIIFSMIAVNTFLSSFHRFD